MEEEQRVSLWVILGTAIAGLDQTGTDWIDGSDQIVEQRTLLLDYSGQTDFYSITLLTL